MNKLISIPAKRGQHNFNKIRGFKANFGTLNDNPTSSYLYLSGYIKLKNPDADTQLLMRRLKGEINRFVYRTGIELFPGLIKDRTYSNLDWPDTSIKDYMFFEIDLDLFFTDIISIRDKSTLDKHLVLLELILELLEGHPNFNIQPRKTS